MPSELDLQKPVLAVEVGSLSTLGSKASGSHARRCAAPGGLGMGLQPQSCTDSPTASAGAGRSHLTHLQAPSAQDRRCLWEAPGFQGQKRRRGRGAREAGTGQAEGQQGDRTDEEVVAYSGLFKSLGLVAGAAGFRHRWRQGTWRRLLHPGGKSRCFDPGRVEVMGKGQGDSRGVCRGTPGLQLRRLGQM